MRIMVSAMKAVADKKITINAAATKFSVPLRTLDGCINGHVQHGNTPGVDTFLQQRGSRAGVVSCSLGRLWFFRHPDHGQGICLGQSKMLRLN